MMTQDEIIRMAQEAGLIRQRGNLDIVKHSITQIERFAALVAAHERNRLAWTQEHWTQYEHAIAAAEREACAKVCDEMANRYKTGTDMSHELLQIGFLAAEYGAYSIRKRGEK